MKILLIGGFGFIGSYLGRELMDRDHEVTVIDKSLTRPENKIVEDYRRKLLEGATLIERDIRESEDIFKEGNFDAVVHLAALPLEKNFDDPESRHQLTTDIELTYDAVRLAKKYSIAKFVYLSSLFAYGDFEYATTEDRQLKPKTAYGIMKAAGEQLVKAQLNNYVIIRTTSVYGFGDLNNRVTDILINRAENKKEAWINVTPLLDFIYIKDLVRGIAQSLLVSPSNEEIHISGGNAVSISDFAQILEIYYPDFTYEERSFNDRPTRGTLVNDKSKQLLGWQPHFSLEKGIEDYMKIKMSI